MHFTCHSPAGLARGGSAVRLASAAAGVALLTAAGGIAGVAKDGHASQIGRAAATQGNAHRNVRGDGHGGVTSSGQENSAWQPYRSDASAGAGQISNAEGSTSAAGPRKAATQDDASGVTSVGALSPDAHRAKDTSGEPAGPSIAGRRGRVLPTSRSLLIRFAPATAGPTPALTLPLPDGVQVFGIASAATTLGQAVSSASHAYSLSPFGPSRGIDVSRALLLAAWLFANGGCLYVIRRRLYLAAVASHFRPITLGTFNYRMSNRLPSH